MGKRVIAERPPQHAIDRAIAAAMKSPCSKTRRGVAIFDPRNERGHGEGWNGPPNDRECDRTDACRAACGKRCVHAEARAIRDMLIEASSDPAGAIAFFDKFQAVHVKISITGELESGGPPSCWQCSREILDVGIGAFWLFETSADPEGVRFGKWQRYTAEEFHRVTLENCELPAW